MTQAVREFLDLFDRLPGPDRHEAIAELLKRVDEPDDWPLDDETSVRIAEEAADGHP